MDDSVQEQIAALRKRLGRVEDELAIHRLIVRYGLAVDAGDAEAAMALFTEDSVYEVGAVGTGIRDETRKPLIMRGRAAVGKMVQSEAHQALLPNAAHTIGPAVVTMAGETASATGYPRIYLRENDDFRLFRMAVNHWELVKNDERWWIHRRTSVALGESDVQDLMRKALERPVDA
ncbi:MAG: nuclear transport factor 2 family protein [Candidatus Binatia bacterium]|nr:nuclear transport factor 2 family protein [Candidatus Binatia bacterium]